MDRGHPGKLPDHDEIVVVDDLQLNLLIAMARHLGGSFVLTAEAVSASSGYLLAVGVAMDSAGEQREFHIQVTRKQ